MKAIQSLVLRRASVVSWQMQLIVVSLVICIGCSSNKEQASVEASCTQLATALSMPSKGMGQISVRDDGVEYREGELLCRFDANERLKSITYFGFMSKSGGGQPLINEEQQAIDIARSAIANTDFSLDGEIRVTKQPWDDRLSELTVSAEPTAYGYPTNGFAGRLSIVLNRYTEKVQSVFFASKRTPDPPNIVVTEAQARQIAGDIWEGSDQAGKENRVTAHLQYMPAVGEGATADGRRYEAEKRLRLCWVVAFRSVRDPESSNTSSGIGLGIVSIDAETGKVLENLT